jgi:hypothetical protein
VILTILKDIGVAAIRSQERDRRLACDHPGLYYMKETLRAAGIFALMLLITDVFSWDVFSPGEPLRRLLAIVALSAILALIRLWRTRRSRPNPELLEWLQREES